MSFINSSRFYFRFTISGILAFVLLWLLLFIEPLNIGALKISQIWKALVVVVMFVVLLNKKKHTYVILGLLFAFKYLFYSYFPYGLLETLKEFLEAMIFPLVLGFLFINYKNKQQPSEQLFQIAIFFSLFFIYSALPFLFGLKSLNPETDLTMYGLQGSAAKGLFYQIAIASKVFSFSTIVIFNSYTRFSNSKLNKIFWLVSVLVGSYLVYASWTRTAWVFFFVAIIISLFYGKSIKKRFLAVGLASVFVVGIFFLYQNSQALRYRITGGAVYRQNTELSAEQLAEARLPLLITAVDNFANEDFMGKLVGYGVQRGIDLFYSKTKMSIVSHNRTFEILESSGFIGLILYLAFVITLYRSTNKYRPYVSLEKRRLSYVMFFLFVGYYLTSHGSTLWGEVIFALVIMSITFEYYEKLNTHLSERQDVKELDT